MQPDNFQSGAKINDIAPDAPKSFSTFPLSYRMLQTHRLGEITPHACWGVEGAFKPSLRCMADTDTYSLKAPLKTDIYQKRNNFAVALQAILPHSYQLIEAQPTEGDDVPQDCDGVVAGSSIRTFLNALSFSTSTISWETSVDEVTLNDYLCRELKRFLILEMFGSQGSLLKNLKYDFTHLFEVFALVNGKRSYRSFDQLLEKFLSGLAPASTGTRIYNFEVTWYDEDGQMTDQYVVVSDDRLGQTPDLSTSYISYRHFLDLARQNLNFLITDISAHRDLFISVEEAGEDVFLSTLSEDLIDLLFGDFVDRQVPTVLLSVNPSSNFNATYNFDMLSAYQLICAHFYSSDYVDYVYTAELFRQLIQYYDDKVYTMSNAVYTWNGMKIRYDALAGLYFTKHFAAIVSDFAGMNDEEGADSFYSFAGNFMTAMFSFRHNLRYKDYFTGGRTKPLSVGDVGVAVSGGEVNAVDIIIKQNTARLFNWAARVGKKWSKQSQKKTGIQPAFDYHDPKWISGTGDLVGADYTQNTGAAQVSEPNSITAKLKANTNRYQFSFEADRKSFIICLTSYDIPRCYAFATDRENFIADRYDMFQPFFQYNGSQAVLSSELGLHQAADTPFAYQGRYMHLKQKYDICAGGFLQYLPGYAFIADVAPGLPQQKNLNPTYIRTWNCELDPFFVSLTGYGLAAYFHFIVKNTNIINEQAPMEYNPQLM